MAGRLPLNFSVFRLLVVCPVCLLAPLVVSPASGCGLLRAAASSPTSPDAQRLRRGELIEQHGCGPHPIPANQLSEMSLVAALRHMQADPVQAAAARLAALLAKEKGAQNAAAAFHHHLPRRAMLCDLDANRQAPPLPCPALGVASWRSANPGGPC